MKTIKCTYWQDGGFFIGFLNEFLDYQTQGASKDELVENLVARSPWGWDGDLRECANMLQVIEIALLYCDPQAGV